MVITATDFQLRVNEYFTKMVQGEEVVIERYGKKFAVLVPYEKFQKMQNAKNMQKNTQSTQETVEIPMSKTVVQPQVVEAVTSNDSQQNGLPQMSAQEVVNLIKYLLAAIK